MKYERPVTELLQVYGQQAVTQHGDLLPQAIIDNNYKFRMPAKENKAMKEISPQFNG